MQSARDRVDDALRDAGFRVYKCTQASMNEELLGVVFDGEQGGVLPTSSGTWRLYQALWACLEDDFIGLTSKQLSRVMGHLSHVWCLGRQLLSIPWSVYLFISKGVSSSHVLLPNATTSPKIN